MVAATKVHDTGLSPFVLGMLEKVFTRFPEIEQVVLFGSRASGRYRPGSDIDLAVFAPDLTEQAFARLSEQLDELPIAFNIDTIHFDRLGNQALKQQILRHGKILYTTAHRAHPAGI